jgi:hypothetical protein
MVRRPRRRLVALSSLFQYLRDKNVVTHNPVKRSKRPSVEGYQGKTRAIDISDPLGRCWKLPEP